MGAWPGPERRWPPKSRAPRRSGPGGAAGALRRPKNRLKARRNPPTTSSFRPEPQQPAAETLPAGSAPRRERRKNGLQKGRSRVSSTRKPALLRTEEPNPENPEEPSKAQDLRSRVGTRSGTPGDLECTISR
ncbi:hypothetical protein NDU88_009241 [Pleurodeles waltl]|uniref:Uncharacterized protein n=1 Tax=Pleurodeles waltl TaxID=8319 RepID=A0AAV7PUE2_PLEWA|nr:hypothetical protein NDU88_009241 [Pleurodeles waltl]